MVGRSLLAFLAAISESLLYAGCAMPTRSLSTEQYRHCSTLVQFTILNRAVENPHYCGK